MNSRRFQCPSSVLSLSGQLLTSHRVQVAALAVALLAHLLSLRVQAGEEARQAPKPLTTRFVKRQPRLSKPLELKKRPEPKRRQIQRRVVSIKARATRTETLGGRHPAEMLKSLARPHIRSGRQVVSAAQVSEPLALAQGLGSARETKHTLDMSLEMLDVDALDTGQYQAMVIQDPTDKRNIKGYVHLALAYPFSVHLRADYAVEDRVTNGLRRLIARLNQWTDIKACLANRVTFDSAEFFNTPWVYLHVLHGVEPTQTEVENLGRYVLKGGFFFFEGRNTVQWRSQLSLMQFVKSALESQGRRQGMDWSYQLLPKSHPIFHCYYDFAGPPIGAETLWQQTPYNAPRHDGSEPWCKGVDIDGRLSILNSNQAYVFCWSDWGHTSLSYVGLSYARYDPTVQFQFGINTMVFALTQEGSITHRLMQSVR